MFVQSFVVHKSVAKYCKMMLYNKLADIAFKYLIADLDITVDQVGHQSC